VPASRLGAGTRCRACGGAVPALLGACPYCGEPRVPPERKLGTLLFADLAGYTSLCNNLDPEEVHGLVRPAMAALRRIVESYGASVPQGIQGDGFMAVFGAPIAHEDDAERAVRAGLALQEHHAAARRRAELATLPGLPDLRVGIASGEVYVAPSHDPGGYSVTGDAVNLASRLCGIARPGQVLVTDRARELTRGAIEFGGPRDRVVKGMADRVRVVRAVRPAAGAVAGRRTLPVDAPFVDREEAFAALDAAWARAARARSEVVVVVGDAGQGKSRFAFEAARRLDADVLSGACAPYGDDSALSAFRSALSRRLGIGAQAATEDVAGDLRGVVDELGLGESAAFVAGWLAGLVARGEQAPRDARAETAFGALRLLFEALGRRRPVLLVLDDLHWADEDELALLGRLAAEPWEAPVLVLGLARPGVAGLDGLPRVDLAALEPPHLSEMLEGLLGVTPSPRVVDELAARTGGNPLFVEECVALLTERGAIDADASRLDRAELARVPNSMRMFIAARLDALPAAEKALLQDASVIGETFWDSLVDVLQPRPDLDALLDSLEGRGLVRRVVPGSLPGAVEVRFRHALTRDVAYESLSRRARADRHRAVADAFQQMRHGGNGWTAPLSLLAHHYLHAWRAGRSDVLRGRPPCEPARLAVSHLLDWATEIAASQPRRAAQALTDALDVTAEAAECIDDGTRARLHVQHAEALLELAESDAGLAEAGRALAIAERHGRPDLVARARLAQARGLSESGHLDESAEAASRARQEFADLGDLSGEADALWIEAMNLRYNDMGRHIQLSRDVFDAYGRAGRRDQQAWLAQDLAYMLTLEGGPDQRRWADEAARLIDRESDLRGRAAMARTDALLALNRREYDDALRLAREAAEDAYDSGAAWVESDALLCQQEGLLMTGELEAAARVHERVVAIADRLRAPRLRAVSDVIAARVAARSRRPALAADLLAGARDVLRARGASLELLESDAAEASIALDAGRWPDVVRLATPLVRYADGRGWGLFAAPARVAAGRAALALDPLGAAAPLGDALDATRRHDVPLLGALAAACVEQAQLLVGAGTTASIGDGGTGLVETRATYAENVALRALRTGDLETAARRFADAARLWVRLGATVWLARALVWQAECLRRLGAADDGVEEPVAGLLADLAAPSGLAGLLRASLPA
jgi:class 3 adenylate cyclase